MKKEPELKELPSGKLALEAEHFRRVVRRIECTKPLAGKGIAIAEKDNGFEISNSSISLSDFAVAIKLNVCSNGQPAEIYVMGFNSLSEKTAAEKNLAPASPSSG